MNAIHQASKLTSLWKLWSLFNNFKTSIYPIKIKMFFIYIYPLTHCELALQIGLQIDGMSSMLEFLIKLIKLEFIRKLKNSAVLVPQLLICIIWLETKHAAKLLIDLKWKMCCDVIIANV